MRLYAVGGTVEDTANLMLDCRIRWHNERLSAGALP